MIALIAGVITAYVTAWLAVPLLERVAWRFRLLDFPGARRHVHNRPVPRLGGIAVFVGFISGIVIAALVTDKGPTAARTFIDLDPRSVALVAAGTILFFIGLLDDLKDIEPAVKLAGQIVAAAVVCYFGFRIDAVSLPPGITWQLGWLAIPVTVLWIVGVSNAINLIDGIDGLAGAVSVIATLVIAASSILLGNPTAHWYAMILAGAMIAFLRFNFAPARIFLGDSGSLVVGFLLAVLSVKAATDRNHVTYPIIPIFALAYPLLDTGVAILRRWLRRTPLSRADDRHIHHQLVALGLSYQRAVGIIALGATSVSLMGLCTAFAPPAVSLAIALCGAIILAALLALVPRLLQYHEFLEAGASFASAIRNSRRMLGDAIYARDLTHLIAASRTLDEVSALLSDAAVDLGFAHISIWVIEPGSPLRLDRTLAHDLWHIDYPIPIPAGDEGRPSHDPMELTIWCRTDGTDRPAGAERIARILAPAIGAWVASLSTEPSFDPSSHRVPIHTPVMPSSAVSNGRRYSMR
jgi:UDP-GlcNAc:undecaprenyl-phosphate GlcNAc-1-phosphate transferase